MWPDGLHELAGYVRAWDMQFGLWIEPEMVNPDSELYRAHPDWILSAGHRVPPLQRHQLVLDLTRPEVSAYPLDKISNLLSEYPIDYVKWDCNRDTVDAGSGRRSHRAASPAASPSARRLPHHGQRDAAAAPRPAAIGDLNANHVVPGRDGDGDRLAGRPERLCRTLLPKRLPATSPPNFSPDGLVDSRRSAHGGRGSSPRCHHRKLVTLEYNRAPDRCRPRGQPGSRGVRAYGDYPP